MTLDPLSYKRINDEKSAKNITVKIMYFRGWFSSL